MAVTLNETPSGNRLHIGIFGKTNSGKSSFINTFPGRKYLLLRMLPELPQILYTNQWKSILLVPVSSSIRQDLMMKENWVHYE